MTPVLGQFPTKDSAPNTTPDGPPTKDITSDCDVEVKPESQPGHLKDEAILSVAEIVIDSFLRLSSHLTEKLDASNISLPRTSKISQFITWANQSKKNKESDVDNLKRLSSIIITEPSSNATVAEEYAELCRNLFRMSIPKPALERGFESSEFEVLRKRLDELCQPAVEIRWSKSNALSSQEHKEGVISSQPDPSHDEVHRERKDLIRFIVELHKRNMFKNTSMSSCLNKSILRDIDSVHDQDIVFLCQVMMEVGMIFDSQDRSRWLMDTHILQMTEMANNTNLSTRSRFMIHDVIYSRRYNWAPSDLIDEPGLITRVQSLLLGLTTASFSRLSEEILVWANKSSKEHDGRILRQIIILIFDRAVVDEESSELCSRLCRKLVDHLSGKVKDIHISDAKGDPASSSRVLETYISHRVKEDYRQSSLPLPSPDDAHEHSDHIQLLKRHKIMGGSTQAFRVFRKDRRIGFFRFIGDLLKCDVVRTENIQDRVHLLLPNTGDCDEEDLECLCVLMTSCGTILKRSKATMDLYLTRISELIASENLSPRLRSLLNSVIQPFKKRQRNSDDNRGEDVSLRTLTLLCQLVPQSSKDDLQGHIDQIAKSTGFSETIFARHLISLIFDLVTSTSSAAKTYAELCRHLMCNFSSKVTDDDARDSHGNRIVGSSLFVNYIEDRAHIKFRGLWIDNTGTRTDSIIQRALELSLTENKSSTGPSSHVKLASSGRRNQLPTLCGRRRFKFTEFIVELRNSGVLTENTVHDFIRKLLKNPRPDDEDMDCLYWLMSLVKTKLDHYGAIGFVKAFPDRMTEMAKDTNLDFWARSAIQDFIDMYFKMLALAAPPVPAR